MSDCESSVILDIDNVDTSLFEWIYTLLIIILKIEIFFIVISVIMFFALLMLIRTMINKMRECCLKMH